MSGCEGEGKVKIGVGENVSYIVQVYIRVQDVTLSRMTMLYRRPRCTTNTTKDIMRMYVSASWRFGGLGGEMCILRFVSGNFFPEIFRNAPLTEKAVSLRSVHVVVVVGKYPTHLSSSGLGCLSQVSYVRHCT